MNKQTNTGKRPYKYTVKPTSPNTHSARDRHANNARLAGDHRNSSVLRIL